jgi:alkylation response protein AidB-like acyl-CoA dehydrogenase
MQLDFTADQESLRDSVRAVLVKECPTSLVRAHVDRVVRGEPSTAGSDLYRTLAALDWPALTVPESEGGIGLGVIELAILAEELGRVIAPGPLLPTVAGFVPALREANGSSWLKAVASGQIAGSLAAADNGGAWSADAVSARVNDDGVLAGTKRYVLAVAEIDELAVVVRDGDGLAVVVVPASDLAITPIRSLDASRSIGHVTLDGVHVAAERRVAVTPDAIARATAEATVAFALELVGTCQSIFDTNVEYAKERHQFGVPIGSFQAVKHKLANMFVAIERARAVALFAAATIEEDDPRRAMATAMAKAAAGECQRLVAQDGIQLLGGIGFTWEHDQHLFVKRAKATDAVLGPAAEHRAMIADLLGI